MKPTIRVLYDRKKQATSKVPALIQIEVYHKGKRKYISTGVKVKVNEWDRTSRKVKGTDNDFNNNYHITSLCRKIEEFIIDCDRKGDEFSFAALDLALLGNVGV